MQTWRRVPLVALAVLVSACATTPAPPVPVVGPSADLARLDGVWRGEYSSGVTGRSGTVVFDLTGAEDHAHGEVWMTSQPWNGPQTRAEYGRPRMEGQQVLTIRFVAVTEGFVEGALDPYQDLETGFTLFTIFHGRVDGDVISGTFVTEDQATGDRSSGQWRVEREPGPPPARLHVLNRGSNDATVWVVYDGNPFRLGTVTGMTEFIFHLPRRVTFQSVYFVFDVVASVHCHTSRHLVDPGEQLELEILPDVSLMGECGSAR